MKVIYNIHGYEIKKPYGWYMCVVIKHDYELNDSDCSHLRFILPEFRTKLIFALTHDRLVKKSRKFINKIIKQYEKVYGKENVISATLSATLNSYVKTSC